MERTCISFLTQWLHSPNRLPLVIRGARQVGKTWVVRHLAAAEKKRLIEINFEDQKELLSVFASNDPRQILIELEEALGIDKIDPEKSILFFDEIQAVPPLYAKLRWFAEKMPKLPVVAAGSLFELLFKKDKLSMSMPVGRVEFMFLEPLSFEEFLLALDKTQLIRLINRFTWRDEIPSFTHDELNRLFKEYIIIGGMPAAVVRWVSTQSLLEVSKVQHNILTTYQNDFYKYSRHIEPDVLQEIVKKVPGLLGTKFVYSQITGDTTAGVKVKKAFDLLCEARVCSKVISVAANGVPLDAEINERFVKAIFLDVGLCSAVLKLSLHELKSFDELSLINSGGIGEQVVGQLLRTLDPLFMEPALYYWLRHEKNSSAEIDYVIQHGTQVVPIEVKAGKTGTLKSLHVFMDSKLKSKIAVRIFSGLPQITKVESKSSSGNSYELRSIPFYLTGELHRLLD